MFNFRMTMDIPPYISVSLLNNPNYTLPTTKEEPPEAHTRETTTKIEDTSITVLPKKRSFDVAFLISADSKPQREERSRKSKSPPRVIETPQNENIRSAFKKVGLGLPKFDSRTPSPIDPLRTPSPLEIPDKQRRDFRTLPREPSIFPHQFSGILPPRDHEKALGFVGGSFFSPAPRNTFLPAPLFTASPIMPSGFVTASLLPPSLAALSLPAQNICAKCNVSFRMTSDLVYHMRSHHKNDHTTPDLLRRRRDLDKLKCPVCNESFRERHHLTRHMTAHQDKAGDHIDKAIVSDRSYRLKYCGSPPEFRQ